MSQLYSTLGSTVGRGVLSDTSKEVAIAEREFIVSTLPSNTWKFCNSEFRIVCKIGDGSFGEVYLGINKKTEKKVAIKIESIDTNKLDGEARIYKILASGTGIPALHWSGAGPNYNAMVIDLLGANLECLFSTYQRKFSLKTVVVVAIQLIYRLEYIHSKSLIHRDIKPENFVMGTNDRRNQVNVIDFGLAKEYRTAETGHIPLSEANFAGTICYASINTHLGIEQSRRDDMESLGYVLLYFYRGDLPWQNEQASTDELECDRVKDIKIATSTKELCKGLPIEFSYYLNHVRTLRFDEKPNYSYLRWLFRHIFVECGFEATAMGSIFDWTEHNFEAKVTEATVEIDALQGEKDHKSKYGITEDP